MIRNLINTLIVYAALLILMSLVFRLDAEASEAVIGTSPGETEMADEAPGSSRPQCSELDKYMNTELQEYIWKLCKDRGLEGEKLKRYYACMIGLAEAESDFGAKRTNRSNGDGTCDRGLYQVNEINVPKLKKLGLLKCSDDLYDPFCAARCGEYLLWQGYKDTGYSEQCYTRYLYGDKKYRSNKYTKRAWKIMQSWYEKLW